jgi:glycosyltransferase involved in cell wall biosynthesis
MKVLFQYRNTYPKILGGDTVRGEHTRQELEKLGVRTRVASGRVKNYRGIDLVHIWQSTFHESFGYARDARRAGVPYVVSTIYEDHDRFGFMQATSGPRAWARSVLGIRAGLALFRFWTARRIHRNPHWQSVSRILKHSDGMLSTSWWEIQKIRKRFPVGHVPAWKTSNALDHKVFSKGRASRFVKQHGLKDFVLCVGRIELNKNQHTLIQAMKGSDRSLVLIGQVTDDQREYWKRCQATAKQLGVEMHHIERLQPDRLADAFAAADCHVLPSYSETPGQVSLQAAMAGCPVVQTAESPWKEYFGDLAEICLPESPKHVRRAITRALRMPKADRRKLTKRMELLTWERSAQETLSAYESVLKKQS